MVGEECRKKEVEGDGLKIRAMTKPAVLKKFKACVSCMILDLA